MEDMQQAIQTVNPLDYSLDLIWYENEETSFDWETSYYLISRDS